MDWYIDNFWAKDRLGAINLPVRVCLHTDQYTKMLSCINLHDHTHQAQPNHLASWRWSYQYGKSYTRCLHHTPIKTRKDYHASTFMIIRIEHNPTILSLELSKCKRATQDGYITHRSKHEKIIMHQPPWSYASSITQPPWRWSYQHAKELHKMVTSHTDQNTKRLSCINLHDQTHQA